MPTNPRRENGTHRSGSDVAASEVESYEDDGTVVLFDAKNPLAWVEANRTIRLADAA